MDFMRRYRILVGAFVFLSIYVGGLYTFAMTYVPQGTVLDPAGLPGNYTVAGLSIGDVVGNATNGSLLYIDNSGLLAEDSLFTRDAVTKATRIGFTNGTVTYSYKLDSNYFGAGYKASGNEALDSSTNEFGFSGILHITPGGGNYGPVTPRMVYFGNLLSPQSAQAAINLGQNGSLGSAKADITARHNSDKQTLTLANTSSTLRSSPDNDTTGFGVATYSSGSVLIGDVLGGADGTQINVRNYNREIFLTANDGANALSQSSFGQSGNSILWDADTTDNIEDVFIQGQNLVGYGIKGNSIYHRDSNTGQVVYLNVADYSSVGDDSFKGDLGSYNPLTTLQAHHEVDSTKTVSSYTDVANNIQSIATWNASGFTQEWNPNNVATIRDYIEQNQDVGGTGIAGNGIIHTDTNTTALTGVFVGDATSNGLSAYTTLMASTLSGPPTMVASVEPSKFVAGDGFGIANKTKFVIDDASGSIENKISTQFSVSNVPGNLFLNVDLTNAVYWLGDGNGVNNGTALKIDDSSKLLYGTSGGALQFSVSPLDTNTLFGASALSATTVNQGNTAFGYHAGVNTTGANNLFAGNNAGVNSTGSYNVMLGSGAGAGVTSGWHNIIIGALTDGGGNGGANVIIGSQAGHNNAASYNTFIGYSSGYTNSTGADNAFYGNASGFSNTTGAQNTFLGTGAGMYVDASENTGVGYYANAGANGATFQGSVSVGNYAGQAQTSNGANTLVGWSAGSSLTAGNSVMVGYGAGRYTTNAWSNVMIGYNSGIANIGGSNNMFLGALSGNENTSGSFNVAVGDTAGDNNATGSSNIFIGSNSGVDVDGWISSIAIGRGATITKSHQMMIGSPTYYIDEIVMQGSGGASCAVDINGTACSSDERLKKNITDLDSSILDKLLNVRTVTFNWNAGDDTETHFGFIAQDIGQTFPELVSTGSDGFMRVNYTGAIPLVVEALRELNLKVTPLADFISAQSGTLADALRNFFADPSNAIETFVADTVKARNQLCVDDVCINKDQLRTLIENTSGQTRLGTTNSGGDSNVTNTSSEGDSGTTVEDSGDTGSTTGDSVTSNTTNEGAGDAQNTNNSQGDSGTETTPVDTSTAS